MKLFFYNIAISLIFFLSVSSSAFAEEKESYAPYPYPDSGYVTDKAMFLSAKDEVELERWLLQVEKETGIEIIVVTIESMSQYGGDSSVSIQDFAKGMFNAYGVGNLPKNDGVLFLVSKNDRKARIELGEHYGHRRDSAVHAIMQEDIIPRFKEGDFASGIKDGTTALIEEFAGMSPVFPIYVVWYSVAGIAFLLLGFSLVFQGKRGWGYVFIGIGIICLLLALLIFKALVEASYRSNRGGFRGGSFGGFGGGFGGGSSGGGGATGSW